MSLKRQSPDGEQTRIFALRGFYRPLKKVVEVHSCAFDSLDSEAIVSLTGSSERFPVKMRDLVLLEHTNRSDINGEPIFEGHIVRGEVENEYGSWEMLEGTVLFDDNKWGFSILFDEEQKWPHELTGLVSRIEIIGNIFEDDVQELQETQKTTRTDDRKGVL